MGARKRIREAVSGTTLPQLERVGTGKRKKSKAKKASAKKKKSKPAAKLTESASPLLIQVRELRRDGPEYEATIIREGPGNERDRNYYTRDCLRDAVDRGLFEGLQAYADHPTKAEEVQRPERSIRQLVGSFREARLVEGQRAEVRAKFAPIAGKAYSWVRDLIETTIDGDPSRPLIGISIDGYGVAPDQQEIGGKTYNVVREIASLPSADLVTNAGAGGRFHRKLSEAELAAIADRVAQRAAKPKRGKPGKTVRKEVASIREADVDHLLDDARQWQQRARVAEEQVDNYKRSTMVAKVIRESGLPEHLHQLASFQLANCANEASMKAFAEAMVASDREHELRIREANGLNRIEGAPPRSAYYQPDFTNDAYGTTDLLARLGISRHDAGLEP
jgi:hypothetical protein